MRHYLYEVDILDRYGNRVHAQGIPFMPKVFAEKQARVMTKKLQRTYRCLPYKYSASKTTIRTTCGTPRGQKSWEDWYYKTFIKPLID